MEVRRIRIVDSPGRPGHVRLTAEVAYGPGRESEAYWFEFSRDRAPELSTSGDPWLVALLPLAVTRSEPLRIEAGVHDLLLDGARRIARIWGSWYPSLGEADVEAPLRTEESGSGSRRSAAFFSGGVDSSFTAVRERGKAGGRSSGELHDLITVGGFDIRLRQERALEELREGAARVAAGLGKELVEVRTNLRETAWDQVDWGRVGHGCAMGAVGLALEDRYRVVHIASTGGYRDLHPWGSHPLTDPLMSTGSLRFVHDGAGHTRVEKIRRLTDHPVALAGLRVCFESGTARNCGECFKCLVTMLTLDLLDALDRCPAFPGDRVDLGLLRRVRCEHPWDYRKARDLRDLAVRTGRRDVVRAVDGLVARSRRRERWSGTLRAVRRIPDGVRAAARRAWEAAAGLVGVDAVRGGEG